MDRAHAAPIYHSPTSSSKSDASAAKTSPPMIGAYKEMPENISRHSFDSESSPVTATPDSGAAPLHGIPISAPRSNKVLGEPYDEPIRQTASMPKFHQQQQFDIQGGLSAASYPTFTRHPPEPEQSEQRTPRNRRRFNSRPTGHTTNTLRQPRKLSKRERKAIKKREVERNMGFLDTIGTVLVGRKKYSVSSPVLQLNEVFGAPPLDLPLSPSSENRHSLASSGASAMAAIAGGIGDNIRSMVESIHKPDRQDDTNDSSMMTGHTDTASLTHSHQRQPSKAGMLKTPEHKLHPGLFPEEEAYYPRADADRNTENPDCPSTIVNVVEIPCQESMIQPTGLPSVKAADAAPNTRSTPVATTTGSAAPRAARAPMILGSHSNRTKLSPTDTPSQSMLTTDTAPMDHPQKARSEAIALKAPKPDLFLFDEEQAAYPRDDNLDPSDSGMEGPSIHAQAVKEVQLDDAHRHPHHDLHPTVSETAAAMMSQGIEGAKTMLENIHLPTHMATAAMAASAARYHMPSAPDIGPQSQQGVVPVYKVPTSNVALTPEAAKRQAMATAAAAAMAATSPQRKVAEESHLEQEPAKYVSGEHHLRHMDIRPTVTKEDLEEPKSPRGSMVSQNDPSVITGRKSEPVQVLPNAPMRSMTHADDKMGASPTSASKTVPSPSSDPQRPQQHQRQPSFPSDAAPNTPAVAALGPSTTTTTAFGSFAPQKGSPRETNPFVAFAARSKPNENTGSGSPKGSSSSGGGGAAREAAPLMAAAAMDAKSDNVVIMNASDETHCHNNQHLREGRDRYELHPLQTPHDYRQHHLHNIAAPTAEGLLASSASFDPVANEFADNKVKRPVGVTPVKFEQDHEMTHGDYGSHAHHHHHHGQGREHGRRRSHEESDKDLKEEERDTVGDLTAAQMYAAAHKPDLTTTIASEFDGQPYQSQLRHHSPASKPVTTEAKTAATTGPAAATASGGSPKGDQVAWIKRTTVTQEFDDDNDKSGTQGDNNTTATLPGTVAGGTTSTSAVSGAGGQEEANSSDQRKDNDGSLFHRISQKLSGRRRSTEISHPYHTTHHQSDNVAHGRRGPAT
ncbi:hypothetical protein B0O80DRAFT_465330 [Mortierella sp. GBAus27b]|nr:hypothetical protein B0O80DRAFT_465330 [Mortierella sp. GBAus27b]